MVGVISDIKNNIAALVVDTVSKFGDTFFDELRQETEVIDIGRQNCMVKFVSKCAVKETRAADIGRAIHIICRKVVVVFHVDIEHKLSCRAVIVGTARAPIPNGRQRIAVLTAVKEIQADFFYCGSVRSETEIVTFFVELEAFFAPPFEQPRDNRFLVVSEFVESFCRDKRGTV